MFSEDITSLAVRLIDNLLKGSWKLSCRGSNNVGCELTHLCPKTREVNRRSAFHQVPHDGDAAVKRGPVRRRVAMLVARAQHLHTELLDETLDFWYLSVVTQEKVILLKWVRVYPYHNGALPDGNNT